MSRSPSSAASAAVLGGALAAIAFGAQAGAELGPTATVSVLVALAAGAVLCYLVLRGRAGPLWGATAVLLLAAFTGLTTLSAAWSIDPAATNEEASRLFAYMLAFAAAVGAGRHFRGRAGVVATAVAIAGVVVCGWALATRIWPGTLGEDLLLTSRLGAPFDYWNALGAMAALAVPPTLWLAARRDARPLGAALAYPALGVMALTILLTQSRGALAAVLLALMVWFAFVPLRLRSAPAVLLPALAAAPVAAWALSRDQFTQAFQPVPAQGVVAGDFGLMVLAMCVFLVVGGPAVLALASDFPPSMRTRRRAGVALVVAAALLPLVAVGAVVASDRGLGGTVSDRFDELTSETQAPPTGSGRLASASSSRGEYWRQAGKIFEDHPLTGSGANTFGLARLPYREGSRSAAHAHGFLAQTLADLGLLGLLTALALLAAWAYACARAVGFLPARRRPEWSGERTALFALLLAAVTFGLQSAIDWIWAVPGTALAALVAAGFVAGRGPLAAATATPEPPPAERTGPIHPARAVAAAGVLVTACLCSWAIWHPQAGARANDRALDLIASGDFRAAEQQAEEARDLNPYATEPLFTLANALTRQGREGDAYRTLKQAVSEHPRDPDTWLRLTDFELRVLRLPNRALATLEGARRLDPDSSRVKLQTIEVQAAVGAGAPPATPP